MSDNPDVPMTPVVSSNVAAVGTEGGDLLVQFLGGVTYRYRGAAAHAGEMIADSSPGGFLNRHIKNRYVAEKE